MILGAGINQLPAIKVAVTMGLYVITVDNIPDSIGHKYSNQFVNCSTVDKNRVLKVAAELNIDGIVTIASDIAVPTVGFVVERLGLPGVRESVANTMAFKDKFRLFQRENNLNHPKFIIVVHQKEITKQLSGLTLPLMIKPVDTSGSRGISVVRESDQESLVIAFENAKINSRSERICVEEFVDGIDISGDGFLVNGRLEFAAITKKYKKNVVVTGHQLFMFLSDVEEKRVIAEVVKTCTAIGYTDGPLDFDARISKDRVTILELSPRLGGNGIPMIIERGTGVDLFTAVIRASLGLNVRFSNKNEIHRNCGSLIFGSDIDGILMHMVIDLKLKKCRS